MIFLIKASVQYRMKRYYHAASCWNVAHVLYKWPLTEQARQVMVNHDPEIEKESESVTAEKIQNMEPVIEINLALYTKGELIPTESKLSLETP